jgi:hypothetical protein
MAFTDALVAGSDARVALVDRREGPGGHWRAAYPFVRLHQASQFYGVASTLLGGGRTQTHGPEVGLQERASGAAVCAYYLQVLEDRLLPTGRVELLAGCSYEGDRRVVSRVSGQAYEVTDTCRVVDATYLSPDIPALTPAPFEVGDGVRVVAVNDLVRVEDAPSQYVVVGSGKTATDAIVWLLARGVDPGALCWVRPREPWMINRAVVQPDPAAFFGMVADTYEAAAAASSLDDLFLRLEDAGVMMRVDTSRTPTMAKAPTLAAWELERLRTVEHVVRLGHVLRVDPGRLVLQDGEVPIARDALVVHCAASGLKYPPRVPVWGADAIRLQAIRSGFPCFGAALTGYVEATRTEDAEKNRLCPPTGYGNSLADWARMNVHGARATAAFSAEPDIKAWADTVPLNPARVTAVSPAVDAALARIAAASGPGIARLAELSDA